MIPGCFPAVKPVPDFVRDLDALNQWLQDGTWVRYALVMATAHGRATTFKIFNTLDELVTRACHGQKVVILNKLETNSDELMKWINDALRTGAVVQL